MPLPQALVNLVNRYAIEGAWDAQQAEINEAIFKAMEFDDDKTRILIRIPNVREYVENKLKQFPLNIKVIRKEYFERLKNLKSELEALKSSETAAEEGTKAKQQEITIC